MRPLAVIAVLAACKSGPAPGPPDAEPLPDASHADDVTVRVLDSAGMPIAGDRILYQDPAGATVAVRTTETDGTARANMPDGGTVTVVDPNDNRASWLGVNSHDVLEIGRRPPPGSGDVKTIRLTIPADPAATADTTYEVNALCSSQQTNVVVLAQTMASMDLVDCRDIADFVIFTRDAGGKRVDGIFFRDIPLATKEISLAGHYTPLVTASVTIAHADSFAFPMSVNLGQRTSRGGYGLEFQVPSPSNGTAAFSWIGPILVAPGLDNIVTTSGNVGSDRFISIADTGPSSAAYTLDAQQAIAAPVSDATIVQLAAADGRLWSIVGPGAVDQPPMVPASFGDGAFTTRETSQSISLPEGGYDAVRQNAFIEPDILFDVPLGDETQRTVSIGPHRILSD